MHSFDVPYPKSHHLVIQARSQPQIVRSTYLKLGGFLQRPLTRRMRSSWSCTTSTCMLRPKALMGTLRLTLARRSPSLSLTPWCQRMKLMKRYHTLSWQHVLNPSSFFLSAGLRSPHSVSSHKPISPTLSSPNACTPNGKLQQWQNKCKPYIVEHENMSRLLPTRRGLAKHRWDYAFTDSILCMLPCKLLKAGGG